jgi:exopolyphosphatase / guanosine-5'-triphosphate,3'-diphosphate pyrophosphatase
MILDYNSLIGRLTVDEIKPRYEFRVWADTLASVHKRLGLMAQPKTAESEETYLISKASDKCNAKIRAALMDIKVLVAEDRGLEQWKPILKAGFPLESSVIATQVFPSLELPPPALPKSAYELDEFLDHLVRTDGRLAIAGVRKTRYQFRIGVCAAEYAEIMINGVPRDTVAVESVDPDAVLLLVRELDITAANTSYIREIKRALGWAEHPSGLR